MVINIIKHFITLITPKLLEKTITHIFTKEDTISNTAKDYTHITPKMCTVIKREYAHWKKGTSPVLKACKTQKDFTKHINQVLGMSKSVTTIMRICKADKVCIQPSPIKKSSTRK